MSERSFTPVYQKLVAIYKSSIISQIYKPGEKIDSISRIQERHNVSRETAKQVLGILASQGLIIQKAGKGSYVADLSPKKNVWAIIIPFHSMQYEELIQYIGYEAMMRGRILEYYVDHNNWEEEIRLVGTMINSNYEAVIVIPTLDESKTAGFYSNLSSRETFISLIDHTMTGSFFSYVIQSYDLGVKRAIDYLVNNASGKTIAFLRSERWLGRNLLHEMMESTYVTELSRGDPCASPVIFEQVRDITPDVIRSAGIGGIFCCDDIEAVRVLGMLGEAGIGVPDNLRLVSYGNTDVARYFTPAISSINPKNNEMAATIAAIIEDHYTGKDTKLCQYVVHPEIIIRKT